MRFFNLRLFIILILFIFQIVLFPQSGQSQPTFVTNVSGVGTDAATFLELGVGARAVAMGGAYAAVANDVSALYWNPAGIVWNNHFQIEVVHEQWFLNTSHDFAGVVVPLPSLNSTIGVSFITLGFGNQPVRTVNYPQGTGEYYDARDIAIGLSYAIAITDRFSFGITGKYINQRIWHESGSAMAIDLGIFYSTVVKGLRLGFSMSNFGTSIQLSGRDLDNIVNPDATVSTYDRVPVQYITQPAPLPLLFRAGISYSKKIGRFGSILISTDVNHPSDARESVDLGAELGFGNMFYLRGGYNHLFEMNSQSGLTLGAGIDWYNTQQTFGAKIDYSWADWGILNSTQQFSVGIIF